jgi:signal-transduction protein with cAMP-binding, CBS, and nucleotidyltransferase domain
MFSTIEKVIFLQNVDVFSEVSTEQLAHIAAIAEVVSYLENDVIYETDQASDALYVVAEGKVRLHRDGEEITTVGAREAFGTWSLFDDEPRVATATAVEDSLLLCIDRDEFHELLTDHTEITQAVLKNVAARIRGLIGRVGPRPGRQKPS